MSNDFVSIGLSLAAVLFFALGMLFDRFLYRRRQSPYNEGPEPPRDQRKCSGPPRENAMFRVEPNLISAREAAPIFGYRSAQTFRKTAAGLPEIKTVKRGKRGYIYYDLHDVFAARYPELGEVALGKMITKYKAECAAGLIKTPKGPPVDTCSA